MTTFDYAVIGGGPGGIAFALLVARAGRSVCLVDAHPELGGCHRVKRERGLHTEHGPKVYLGSSRLFFGLAEALSGKKRDDLFARYEHTVFSAQVRDSVAAETTAGEKLALAGAVLLFAAGRSFGKETVLDYARRKSLSRRAIAAIDGLCRLLDGGGAEVTLMDSFLDSIDSGFFQRLYVARAELDDELWKPAEAALAAAGVRLYLGAKAASVARGEIRLEDGTAIRCHRGVLAMPPSAVSRIRGAPEEIDMRPEFVERTRYRRYVSATVDFGSALPRIWGKPEHPWSEITLDHGAYAGLGHGRVLISINAPATPDENGITADSLETRGELERALKSIAERKYRASAETCVLSPTVERVAGLWQESDAAWLLTPEGWFGHGGSEWLFTTGHHAGQGTYRLNVCESAVQNAHALARRLEGVGEPAKRPFRLRDALWSSVICLIFILVI